MPSRSTNPHYSTNPSACGDDLETKPESAHQERRRLAEEARLHRLREAREHLEAYIAKRDIESRLRVSSRKIATVAKEVSGKVPATDPDSQSATYGLDDLLADLDMDALAGTETHAEVIEKMTADDLGGDAAAGETADAVSNEVTTSNDRVGTLTSNEVTATSPELSKEVTGPTAKHASNKVTRVKRRRDSNDRKALESIRNYRPAAETGGLPALVATSPPSISPPPSDTLAKPSPRKKRSIGAWDHTSDRMKLAAATTALQVWENATSWSFDLTPGGEAKALASGRFIRWLARAFNRALKRKLGFVPHYLFSADITKKGRLHLHGAIQADDTQRPLIEEAMKEAWGEWKGRGKDHQVDWNPQRCDDGWPDYFLKARARVKERIGDHTYVITKELRRKAKFIHNETREIVITGR